MGSPSSTKAYLVSFLFEDAGLNKTADLPVTASNTKAAASLGLLQFVKLNPTYQNVNITRVVRSAVLDETAGLLHNSAEFSPDMVYRYVLKRVWSSEPLVQFIGLNPSSASLQVNDPSIRRCIGFAKAWGYGGLIMTNAFGLRATSPTVLRAAIDPIGPENDRWLVASSKEAALVVAAWGNHGEFGQRSCAIRALGMPLHHLGLTASGMPKHPLYLKASLKPVRWT